MKNLLRHPFYGLLNIVQRSALKKIIVHCQETEGTFPRIAELASCSKYI